MEWMKALEKLRSHVQSTSCYGYLSCASLSASNLTGISGRGHPGIDLPPGNRSVSGIKLPDGPCASRTRVSFTYTEILVPSTLLHHEPPFQKGVMVILVTLTKSSIGAPIRAWFSSSLKYW